jgi:phage shock protein PspC (stress-responsive transcriptional regulator)
MKHLYKSRKNKMLAGVCGGLAEYFDVDPVLVRIIFIVFTIFGGFAVLAYIIGAIIIPYPPLEPSELAATSSPSPTPPPPTAPAAPVISAHNNGALIVGVILMVLGAYFLMRNIPLFHDFYWWIHWHIHDYIVPAILIMMGTALLIKGTRKSAS